MSYTMSSGFAVGASPYNTLTYIRARGRLWREVMDGARIMGLDNSERGSDQRWKRG